MKGYSVAFWWFAVCATVTLGQMVAAPADANSLIESVVERGDSYTVMETTRVNPGAPGQPLSTTGRFTVLGNGLNRKDDDGNWVQSQPVVRSYPAGIVCTGATYRVILATNLNSAGAVDLETSDQQRIVSNPLGIGFFDPESGRSVLLAQIKDCQAEVSSNVISFRDAFEGSGITAAIAFRYQAGHFRQDVSLLTRPSVAPADFDMGDKTRLEVLTEILESPEPDVTVHVVREETNATTRASMVEPDLIDQTIRLGAKMVMVPGRAYGSDEGSASRGVPVLKSILNVEGRRVLVEAVEWEAVRAELEKLPRQSAALRGPLRQASQERQLPPRDVAQRIRQSFGIRLAQAQQSPRSTSRADNGGSLRREGKAGQLSALQQPRGLVLDYTLVEDAEDFTFQGGQTYLVNSEVWLDGVEAGVTIESGAVVKFAAGASLNIMDLVNGPSGSSNAIFTALDDESAGQSITNSIGYPSGRYAANALAFYYVPAMYLGYLDIRYAETGLHCDGSSWVIYSSAFLECDTGAYAAGSTISLVGVDWCGVDTPYDHDAYGSVSESGSSECAVDRDGDGLNDGWEQQNFGNLSQSATNDYDGDGLNNWQEYTNHTDPNTISFSFSVPNQYVTTNVVTGTISVLGGVPSGIAVLVDSTNFAGATWTAFTSSNVTVNLGASQGQHDVRVGLRGRLTTSQQTWEETTLVLDSQPPSITITNPPNNASLATSRINVRGSFSCASLQQITVNGVPAFASGGSFDALNVPLDAGTNLITAVIESFSGATNSASINVIGVTNAVDPVQLTADPVAGFAPLAVTFTIQTNVPGTLQQVLYDFNGDDAIDLITNTLQSLAYTYATNGEYFPVVTIQTTAGWFSSSGGWTSFDPGRLRINVQAAPEVIATISVTDPVDIQWTAPSNLYVLSGSTATLTQFGTNGNTVRSLSGIGSNPSGIGVDGAGNVYVAVTASNQVWKLKPTTSSFTLDTGFGVGGRIDLTNAMSGTNAGEFNAPFDVAVSPDGGEISVSDSGNHRIQQFGTNGVLLTSFGGSGTNVGQFNTPKGLTYDAAGTLYVADSGNNRIVLVERSTVAGVTGTNGTALAQFNGPANISFDDRAVYVADTANNRIQSFKPPEPHNPFSSSPSTVRFAVSTNLNQPAAVAATESLTNETFYIADTGNNRVLLYRLAVDDPTPAWSSMTARVAAGDVSGAVSHFSILSADDYRHDFLSIGTANAKSAISQIGTLTPVFIHDDKAQYYFQQVIDGQTITFPVEFVKENGMWKTLEF